MIRHKTKCTSYKNLKVLQYWSFLMRLWCHINWQYPAFSQKHETFTRFSSYSGVLGIKSNYCSKIILHIILKNALDVFFFLKLTGNTPDLAEICSFYEISSLLTYHISIMTSIKQFTLYLYKADLIHVYIYMLTDH